MFHRTVSRLKLAVLFQILLDIAISLLPVRGQTCSAMVKATAGDDLASLRDKTFAAFRKQCRPNKDPLHEIKNPEWRLVFKGVAGTGVRLYDMWTREEWNSSYEVKGHYRDNSLYQAWGDGQLNVRQVKLSVYDSTGVRAELTFNGTGSDTMNWFNHGRLTSSPWDDLKSTPFNGEWGRYFSLEGHDQWIRRFYINDNFGGCEIDKGWLVVIDFVGSRHPCQFESMVAYPHPVIIYSTTTSRVRWHDVVSHAPAVGRADGLTIHIDAE